MPRWSTATGTLGHDVDAKRVRERAVVADGDDGRQRLDPALERARRRARAGSCRRAARAPAAPAAGRRRARRSTSSRPIANVERLRARPRRRRRRARRAPSADGERAARRSEPGERRQGQAPLGARQRDGRRARTRRPCLRGSSPAGHPARFAAGAGAPTRAAAARARRGARPRGASSTPYCSCARRRASAMSASASAVVAPPAFSMKFACFGEICAPPIRWPLRPHASSIRPARELVLRVLEDAAERPPVRRLRRLAPRVQLAHLRLDLGRVARAQAQLGLRRRPGRAAGSSAGTRARAPPGVSQPVPSAVATSARSSTLREVAAVGAAVHPDAAADRARDRARELEAAEARRCARWWSTTAFAAPPPARTSVAVEPTAASSPASFRTSASTPSSATSRFEPSPTVATASSLLGRPAQQLLDLGDRLRPRERARRAAGAERRVARELDAFLEPHASSLQQERRGPVDVAGAEREHGVARARPATRRGARASSSAGAQPMRIPGRTLRELVDDQPTAHARERLLARRIDLGDADRVRASRARRRTRARDARVRE